MSTSFPLYLILGFFGLFLNFLRHWYLDSFYFVWQAYIGALRRWDRIFAVSITIRYWFKPLYQDYTFLGRILGFILRTIRIIIGGFGCLVLSIIFLALYTLWLMVPILLLTRAIMP